MSEEKDKKISSDEKKFSVVTKESVTVYAESAGFADVAEGAAAILGEDVSYRLREITQKSVQYMKHAKRRRLSVDDFNKALKQSDVQPVYGHRSPEPPSSFKPTRDGEVHFVEDADTNLANLAFNSYIPKNLGETTIKAHWLAIEGVQKTSTQNAQGKPAGGKPELSDVLLKYYDKVTAAILGLDDELMKIALRDLKTNPQIVPLLPYFISFVSNGVKTVSHDQRQLMKLLYTVNSLVGNSSLFLEPKPYLVHLVETVNFCLLDSSINPTNDHWCLRDYAARLLAQIVCIWSNPVNQLLRFTEKTLREALYDHEKPFCSHYGAVMGLFALGSESVERVLLPHLSSYWAHLTNSLNNTATENALVKADAHKVYGALLQSVEYILRIRIKDFREKCIDSSDTKSEENVSTSGDESLKSQTGNVPGFLSAIDKSPNTFYNEMHEYFGDSLSMRLPELQELRTKVFKSKPKEIVVSLADPEEKKSGEQLLDELMEQVRIQEEIDRKRREQERIEKEKRDKEERERLERERIEFEKRMEEQRLLRQQKMLERMPYKKRRMAAEQDSDEDEDIDVEGDVNSDKSEEEETYPRPGGSGDVSLAVKSTVSGPGQGIKLTITKTQRPRLKLNIRPVEPPSVSRDQREAGTSGSTKHGRKRKQSLRSPKDLESFEFIDDPEFEQLTSYTSLYSSEGEGSSDGGSYRKPLTLKIKKREAASD